MKQEGYDGRWIAVPEVFGLFSLYINRVNDEPRKCGVLSYLNLKKTSECRLISGNYAPLRIKKVFYCLYNQTRCA